MRAAWWWIDRWRKSTAYTDMTAEEQGLYRNLLDEVWHRDDGIIPDDPRILANVSGDVAAWKRSGKKVLRWMKKVDGGWTNETALEVQHQSVRRSDKQRAYRERLRLVGGNGAGNAAGNNPGSPSPSLIRDLSNDLDISKDLGRRPERVKNTRSVRVKKPRAAESSSAKEPGNPQVREFLEWFPQEYKARRHGADYLVHWSRDAPLVKKMLHATSLEQLKLLAQAMLSDKCRDEFITDTDRGIGILSVKFNWLSDRVAEWQKHHMKTN